ncbi:MAG: prepilin-type N-terminal cleavage/methylation domain-containing protein, partial [Planctomycetota bacterium]
MGLTRASHARAVPPATRQRGLTLLELLTVLTILTAIFALSAGVYRTLGRSHALPAAASQVSSVIRAARNFSLSSGLPSRVFLEPEADRVSAFGFELIASWHLEDARELAMIGERIPPGSELSGAFGERALVVGEVSVTRGRVGAGLEFANDGAALVARHRPALYSPHGFSLEAWVSFWPPPPPKASNRGK